MDCSKLREIMDLYVDRELSPEARAQADLHISECDRCRRAVDRLLRLRDTVRTAASDAPVPEQLLRRVHSIAAPPWRVAWRTQAIAAVILLAGVLSLLSPAVRGTAADTLDYVSFHLDDSRPVVLEGEVLCRDCELQASYGYPAMCNVIGHHGALETSDGRIWNLLEGTASQGLIHDASLLGRRVVIRGRMFRKAGTVEVTDYQLL